MIDALNIHYQRNISDALPIDVHDTWEKYVAMAIDWWYERATDP